MNKPSKRTVTARTAPSPAGDDLVAAMRHHFGHDAFLAGQEDTVRAVLAGRDAVVVRPTGSGKSLTYQLPAVLLEGITVVVSPLIALMKDQVDDLRARGVDAHTIHSNLRQSEAAEAMTALEEGRGSILYVTPERFRDRRFFATLLARGVALFVVDEAHCISHWGHDFRPDYMTLGAIAARLGRPPVMALTATATPDVLADIMEQLGLERPHRSTDDLIRPNLFLEVRRTVNAEAKDAALVELLGQQSGSGIVYVATVKEAERLHDLLGGKWNLTLYHGRRTAKQRREAQDAFMAGEVKGVVATNAFGLGIDKPDIRFVVHYDFPGSPEAYYQEAGRAGRDGAPALCSILYRVEDRRVQSYFLGGKYPDLMEAAAVGQTVNAQPLGERRPLTELAEQADVSRRKARVVLTLLKRHAAVREHRGGAWERLAPDVTRVDLRGQLADYEARRHTDREKLAAMERYCRTARCRTRYLLDFFGEEPAADWTCGHCDNDTEAAAA